MIPIIDIRKSFDRLISIMRILITTWHELHTVSKKFPWLSVKEIFDQIQMTPFKTAIAQYCGTSSVKILHAFHGISKSMTYARACVHSCTTPVMIVCPHAYQIWRVMSNIFNFLVVTLWSYVIEAIKEFKLNWIVNWIVSVMSSVSRHRGHCQHWHGARCWSPSSWN